MSHQKNYIDNKKFETVIRNYKASGSEYEEELIEMFDLLITNIYKTFNFNIEMEDSKQECFLLLLKTLRNFDPDNGSAFNYFTTIIINNFKLIYTKNKKYNEKLEEYYDLFLDSRFRNTDT